MDPRNFTPGWTVRGHGIAGALLNDPDLLLLDEPANGLHSAGIVVIREMLRSLAASGNIR